jgi:hypothetical protein
LIATLAEKLPPLSKSKTVLHPIIYFSRKICSQPITILLAFILVLVLDKKYIGGKSRYIRYIVDIE